MSLLQSGARSKEHPSHNNLDPESWIGSEVEHLKLPEKLNDGFWVELKEEHDTTKTI